MLRDISDFGSFSTKLAVPKAKHKASSLTIRSDSTSCSKFSKSFEFAAVKLADGVLTECTVRSDVLDHIATKFPFVVFVCVDHNMIGEMPSIFQSVTVLRLPLTPAQWLVQEQSIKSSRLLLFDGDSESVYVHTADSKLVRGSWAPMDSFGIALRPLLLPPAVVMLLRSAIAHKPNDTDESRQLLRIASSYPHDAVYRCRSVLEDAIIRCSAAWLTTGYPEPVIELTSIFDAVTTLPTASIYIDCANVLVFCATEELVHATEQITGVFSVEKVTLALSKLEAGLAERVKRLPTPYHPDLWLSTALSMLAVQNTLHEIVRAKRKAATVESVPPYVRGVELLHDGLHWYEWSVVPAILDRLVSKYNAFIAVNDKPIVEDAHLETLGKAVLVHAIDEVRTAVFVHEPSAAAATMLTDMKCGVLLASSSFAGDCYRHCKRMFDSEAALRNRIACSICADLETVKEDD